MEIDKNGLPFVRLPAPFNSYIVTPPRPTDGPAMIEMMNDPAVYMYLFAPPFPYTQESFDEFYPIFTSQAEQALKEYQEVVLWREERKRLELEGNQADTSAEKWVGAGVPFRCIRMVHETTGEEPMVGQIGIQRRRYAYIKDEEARDRRTKKNNDLPAGDPRIEWEIGFGLSSKFHGRGIMPAVLRTLTEAFFIPFMNTHLIGGGYFTQSQNAPFIENKKSRRVFEKNGYEYVAEYPDVFELAESKVGKKGVMVGMGWMQWTRDI